MSFKALDRVAMRNSYSGSVTVRNGSAHFRWDHGDPATVVEESGPNSGVYWLKFDKDPSQQVLVSTAWFELLPGEMKVAATTLAKKDCTCDLKTVLMTKGCMCGAWKRYVEPHKRLVS